MHLVFLCCVCGLMSPAAGVWLQDATYLAACMACFRIYKYNHKDRGAKTQIEEGANNLI